MSIGGEDPSSSLPLSSSLSFSESERGKSVYSTSVNSPLNIESIENIKNIDNTLIRSDSSSFLIPEEKGMDKECSAKYGKFDIIV